MRSTHLHESYKTTGTVLRLYLYYENTSAHALKAVDYVNFMLNIRRLTLIACQTV